MVERYRGWRPFAFYSVCTRQSCLLVDGNLFRLVLGATTKLEPSKYKWSYGEPKFHLSTPVFYQNFVDRFYQKKISSRYNINTTYCVKKNSYFLFQSLIEFVRLCQNLFPLFIHFGPKQSGWKIFDSENQSVNGQNAFSRKHFFISLHSLSSLSLTHTHAHKSYISISRLRVNLNIFLLPHPLRSSRILIFHLLYSIPP